MMCCYILLQVESEILEGVDEPARTGDQNHVSEEKRVSEIR